MTTKRGETMTQHEERVQIDSVLAHLACPTCFNVAFVCFNVENVKEQHQGEAEKQSIFREIKHPSLISDVGLVCMSVYVTT